MVEYFPNATNITNWASVLQYDNTITGGFFGIAIVAALTFITFLALKGYPTRYAVVVSTFVAFVSSLLFSAVGIVTGYLIVVTAVAFIGAAVMLYMGE